MRLASALIVILTSSVLADEPHGIELAGPNGLNAWREPKGEWVTVGAVRPDPENPKRLATDAGSGILVNGKLGRTFNLLSKQDFGDIETHIEFLIPKGSNAGVKFEGLYEVQIFDSWGVKNPTASDCGGIYPRAELLPKYRYLDKGYPPKVNACKPPGEWQTLDVVFYAPKFGPDGKKIANAKFGKVVLNGQVVQENLEVPTPTGHAYRDKEIPSGPILLQADHGPVAFRSVRVRSLSAEAK